MEVVEVDVTLHDDRNAPAIPANPTERNQAWIETCGGIEIKIERPKVRTSKQA